MYIYNIYIIYVFNTYCVCVCLCLCLCLCLCVCVQGYFHLQVTSFDLVAILVTEVI